MKNFESWYLEMLEDDRWYEQASMHHSKETFEKTARQVYVTGITKPDTFFISPMSEHRNHVYNKLCKLPHDKPKKNWHEESLKIEEAKRKASEPEWKPVSWEKRAEYLKQVQAIIDGSTMAKGVAPLTAKERLENQDWRPKPEEIHEPSQMEKIAAARKHFALVRQSRSLTFLEAYPDASAEEIEAYLDKFIEVDDPLKIARQ